MRIDSKLNDPYSESVNIDVDSIVERVLSRGAFYDLVKNRVMEMSEGDGYDDEEFLNELDRLIERTIETEMKGE